MITKYRKKIAITTIGIIVLLIIIYLFYFSPLFYKYTIYQNNNALEKRADTVTYDKKKGKIDSNNCSIEFKFSGIDTIWKFTILDKTELEISSNYSVSNGDFKVVLVSENSKLIDIKNNHINKITLEKGTYKLRIAGLKADGKLDLNLKYSSSILVDYYN